METSGWFEDGVERGGGHKKIEIDSEREKARA